MYNKHDPFFLPAYLDLRFLWSVSSSSSSSPSSPWEDTLFTLSPDTYHLSHKALCLRSITSPHAGISLPPISPKNTHRTPSPPLLSRLHRLRAVTLRLRADVSVVIQLIINEGIASWRKRGSETKTEAETRYMESKDTLDDKSEQESNGSSGWVFLLLWGFPPGSNLGFAW